MSRAEEIASALGAAKKTPEGYICRCPCHDDKSASLSLKVNETGGIILNCFAGCSWQDIKAELERRGIVKPKSTSNTPARRQPNRYEGATFYVYRDLVGNILCRKVKLPSKKMWFERLEGGEFKPGLAGMIIPLYNLQSVLESDHIYLCEGEKDAETLIRAGFCGTTNHAGAKSWAPHLTESLKNKTVIILPDNDDAGRKRVSIIAKALQGTVKELRAFIPEGLDNHGDISDWVQNGGDCSDILAKSVPLEKRKESKKATRQDYYELFETVLNNPRRCIFNEKLMTQNPYDGIWNPAVNSLELLKSEALTANETRESKFSVGAIQPHFFSYESTKQPEFLCDIPEWDNLERIQAMANLMQLKASAGITAGAFAELLMEWCARVFKRLADPMEQNRILVLQGGQGIGKDTWTSMLVDGLGQFSIPLAVVQGDKDTYLNLHRGLIMKISEFDKTAKTEVSTLKDIITTPSTNIRAPYDKDSRLRYSRCSFISSANVNNLLRDSTGNRRFLIFELERIEFAYSGWSKEKTKHWQMQCLAEMKYLCEIDYKASPASWQQMNEYIEKQTPEEFSVDVTENFIQAYRADSSILYKDGQDIMPSDATVRKILSDIARTNGIRIGAVRSMIHGRLGVYRRIEGKRFWAWRLPEAPAISSNVDETFEQGLGL